MRMLLSLVLPMLALPFTTVHVGAHPLQLAARAPRGETNHDAQILARSQDASQPPPGLTLLGGVRFAVLSYYAAHTTDEEKGKHLEHLLTITPSQILGNGDELEMIRTLLVQGVSLKAALNDRTVFAVPSQEPGATTHTELLNLRASYQAAPTVAEKGRRLQEILSFFSRWMPGTGTPTARTLITSFQQPAVLFRYALGHLSGFYDDHRLSLGSQNTPVSTRRVQAMNNFAA